TARTRVLDQLSRGGPLAGIEVAAAAPDPTQVDNDNARPGEPRDLDDDALQEMAALAGVRSVVPIETTRVVVVPPDPFPLPDGRAARLAGGASRRDQQRGATFETLVGTDLLRADDLPITLLAGRLPQPSSPVEVAVTTTWLARFGLDRADAAAPVGLEVEIGAPRAFGDRVRARWARALVVGVVAQQAAPGALLGSLELVRPSRTWTASGPPDQRFDIPTSPYSAAFVVARELDQVSEVRNQITDIGYSTRAPENLIATVQRYLHVVEIVLSGIGLISLVIAALGVTNTLLAAVRERRREIGVLKAIGARDRDVLRLFLLEAGVLGLVGGVVGTLGGLATAALVATAVNRYLESQSLQQIEPQLSWGVVVIGVVGAAVLALVAGAMPAQRAARLPAREAVDE
ncbi:MAG: FtsX-like permease family protein, partial [Acidimicrobiia bacterium]|nr:FtsX-like permease family protein [Acidimicrobiia bacterium]